MSRGRPRIEAGNSARLYQSGRTMHRVLYAPLMNSVRAAHPSRNVSIARLFDSGRGAYASRLSGRVSLLLPLEAAPNGRATADRNRAARVDPANELENPLWGAPRIHGELLKLGFEVAQSSVAKYMVKRRGPPSQGWRTFVTTRRTLPPWTCSLFQRSVSTCSMPSSSSGTPAETSSGKAPHYLIRDRDRIYGSVVTRRLRSIGMRDKPTASASPWQNGVAERLIGSIRRECVDHIIVLSEMHLRRVLKSYADYYNSVRTHRSLNKDAPVTRPVQRSGVTSSRTILGGLHHHYALV